MASQYKRTTAPPRPGRRTPPVAALHPYDGQAALLLDSVGTILAVTGTAAGLLNRPERELTGRSFGVLPPELSVQLDLTGTPGGRKVVTARAVSSEMGKNWSVVLLEDASRCQRMAEAAGSALLDAAPLLRTRGLTARVQPWWPEVAITPSLRPLLASAIRCLAEINDASGSVLRLMPRVNSSGAIIALDLLGGRKREPDGYFERFAETLAEAEAAQCFLRLEMGENGLALELTVPLARTVAMV